MRTKKQLTDAAATLRVNVKATMDDHTLSAGQKSAMLAAHEREHREITAEMETVGKAAHMAAMLGSDQGAGPFGHPGNGSGTVGFKAGPHQSFVAKSDLENLHQAAMRGTQYRANTKSFTDISTILPGQMQDQVVPLGTENTRLGSYLIQAGASSATVSYIRHTGTTGSAAATSPGSLKPELVIAASEHDVPLRKLAARTSTTQESLDDYVNWGRYISDYGMRHLVDVETDEILNGSGTAPHLQGILGVSGILSHTIAASGETKLNALETSIALMRAGAAYATANLMVMAPATYSALRQSADSTGQYILQSDPRVLEAATIWGIPVIQTTQIAADTVLLLDTLQAATLWTRQAPTILVSSSGTNFSSNIVETVFEERIAVGVMQTAAVCKVTLTAA